MIWMSTTEEVNGRKAMAETLIKPLEEMSGYEFTVERFFYPASHWACLRKEPDYPVKTSDRKDIGMMFRQAEFRHVYFDEERRIKWPDDWIDPYPVFIDGVHVYDRQVEVTIRKDLDWYFMCNAYYSMVPVTPLSHRRFGDFSTITLAEREDRMKAARLIPAGIRDIQVFLKFLAETLQKHSINSSEVQYDFFDFGLTARYSTYGMDKQEVVGNAIRRATALAEHRKRFKLEWLPSQERKKAYESTMLFEKDPFRKSTQTRHFCKWPFKTGNYELDSWYEGRVREDLEGLFWPVYDLNGHGLKLVGHETYAEPLGRKRARGGQIAIDEGASLEPFPLEKIEFLKEDFPELFGEAPYRE